MPAHPNQAPAPEQRRGFMQQFGRLAHLTFVIPAATLAGWFIGSELDKWLHTSWIYIAGLVIGVIAGFIDVIRTAMAEGQ